MTNIKNKIRLYCWGVLAFLIGSALPCYAQQIQAEVVWVEYEQQQHKIQLSRYDGNKWTQSKQAIYTSENELSGPVLGTASNGEKLLIWTERGKFKTALMKMSASNNGNLIWSKPSLFYDAGKENFSASIVVDTRDVYWVFFASTISSLADVYLTKRLTNGWTAPELIHQPNEVPDYAPHASLTLSGDVQVEWHTYDHELASYKLDSKTFLVKNQGKSPNQADQIEITDVPIPLSLPNNQRITMHFPLNIIQQSVSINNRH